MVDPLVVKRKLQKMLEYLNELESMRDITLEDYVKDFRNVPPQQSHRVPDVRTSLPL